MVNSKEIRCIPEKQYSSIGGSQFGLIYMYIIYNNYVIKKWATPISLVAMAVDLVNAIRAMSTPSQHALHPSFSWLFLPTRWEEQCMLGMRASSEYADRRVEFWNFGECVFSHCYIVWHKLFLGFYTPVITSCSNITHWSKLLYMSTEGATMSFFLILRWTVGLSLEDLMGSIGRN